MWKDLPVRATPAPTLEMPVSVPYQPSTLPNAWLTHIRLRQPRIDGLWRSQDCVTSGQLRHGRRIFRPPHGRIQSAESVLVEESRSRSGHGNAHASPASEVVAACATHAHLLRTVIATSPEGIGRAGRPTPALSKARPAHTQRYSRAGGGRGKRWLCTPRPYAAHAPRSAFEHPSPSGRRRDTTPRERGACAGAGEAPYECKWGTYAPSHRHFIPPDRDRWKRWIQLVVMRVRLSGAPDPLPMVDNIHWPPFRSPPSNSHAAAPCALEARPLGGREKALPSPTPPREHEDTVGAGIAFNRMRVVPRGAPRAYGVSWGEGEGG